MCYYHSSIEKHKGKVSINRLIKCHICLILSSSLTLQLTQWSCHFVDLVFLLMRFHSMAGSLFIFEKNGFIVQKMTWSHHLFLFYFFKGKQNEKENPKCDSLFGKDRYMKNRVWVWGSGYLLRRYGKDYSTPLSP